MGKRRERRAIAHVSSAHPFTDNRIHYRECVTLAEAGFTVTLIATDSALDGIPTAVRVIRLPRRTRVRRMLFSSLQAVHAALRSGAQVLHLHDPELIPFIPLLRVAGRTVVYDAHEDLPVQVLDKPYVSRWTRRPLAGVARMLLWVAARAHLVVAATETIASRFPDAKTILVRNYPPLRAEESVLPPMDERGDIAIYIGALSRTRGIAEVVEATKHPDFPAGWQIHLAGRLAGDVAPLVRAAEVDGRVVYHGELSPLAARDLLLTAKVGLVTLHSTPAYLDSLPTKLFEYFAAGVPAIASDFPLWRDIVEPIGGGVLVDETDPAAIARAVAAYATSPETWISQSIAVRRAAEEELNWAKEGEVLVAAYERATDR